MAKVHKPHLVCIPYPAQSHIGAMTKLAKVLHLKGFCITFVNTEHNHKRLLKSRGPQSLDGFQDFQFRAVSDGLPPLDDFDREKVEKLVREVMGGNEGVKLKKKAEEWKKLAEEATSGPNGSSCLALDNLVNKLKVLSSVRAMNP